MRKLGFEYLACETFAADLDAGALAARGYPLPTDGVYTREPLFADFVRHSLKLGYLPVAYESDGTREKENATSVESINQRETDQADNLVERIFRRNPKAKVFIYVGCSHLCKKAEKLAHPEGAVLQWMAGRLKQATGIDPLTIDQATMTDPAAGSADAALIEETFSRAGNDSAVVLRRRKESSYLVLGPYEGDADLQVLHRRTKIVNGRPDWMLLAGYRTATPVPSELMPKTQRRLIQAYLADEKGKAIPIDQVIVPASEQSSPALMLPAGQVRFSYEDP